MKEVGLGAGKWSVLQADAGEVSPQGGWVTGMAVDMLLLS